MTRYEKFNRFEVRRTEFHGGGTISYHRSLKEAIKLAKSRETKGCECGCTYIAPIKKH